MPTISQLPVATSVGSTDIFPFDQVGVTKSCTASLITALIQSTLQISESQVTNLTSDLAARLQTANNLSELTATAGTARANIGLPALTNGETYIGSTGINPVAGTITGSGGITVSTGAGTINISGNASSLSWTDVTATSQAMVAENGYTANNAGLVTLTLPLAAAYGTGISIIGKGAGGWSIAQNSGQNIQVGSLSSTTGAGGSVSSTNRFDSINLVCTTANTTWTVMGGVQGNLTIV